MRRVICLGDSLTYGEIGAGYIDDLSQEIIPVNKGINGDLTENTLRRLRKILDNEHYADVKDYVVEIGINDVLLNGYTFEDDTFEKRYGQILELLHQAGKRVIAIGLPLIEYPGFPFSVLERGSYIIKSLASKFDFAFLDILMLQWEAGREYGEMTVDGCHFNPISAKLLAQGINCWLDQGENID